MIVSNNQMFFLESSNIMWNTAFIRENKFNSCIWMYSVLDTAILLVNSQHSNKK